MRLCIIIAIISITLILLGDVLLPLIPLIIFYPTYEGIKYNSLYQNGAEIQYFFIFTFSITSHLIIWIPSYISFHQKLLKSFILLFYLILKTSSF